jgi:DNA-directed RNA polymerase specialized sigma subunit
MLIEGDTKSNLIKKVQKDIFNISADVLDDSKMIESMTRLINRCSSQKYNGCRIDGIMPFSNEEETEFFKLYYTVRYLMISHAEKEHFLSLHENFSHVRTILIYQHMPLVESWVGMHRGARSRHLMCDMDRKSEGNRILIDCVDRFDPSKNVKFSGYIYQSMNNMLFKDARDNKKHKIVIEDPDGDVSASSSHAIFSPCTDDHMMIEARIIWDDLKKGSGAAKFLTDMERSIIATDLDESNADKDQDCKAKSLNMNMETYRKRKKNALQKIKDAIIARICGDS